MGSYFKMPHFCIAFHKTSAKTIGMLRKVYGINTMSLNVIYNWHKMFREGRGDVEDEDRSGRTLMSDSD